MSLMELTSDGTQQVDSAVLLKMAVLSLPADLIVSIVEKGNIFHQPLSYTCKTFHLALTHMEDKEGLSNSSEFLKTCAQLGLLDLFIWGVHYIGYLPCTMCWWDAVSNGHLPILKWLYENGYDSSSYGDLAAASGGHIDVLKWLEETGFPMNWKNIYSGAISGNNQVIEEWALSNKKPEEDWKKDKLYFLISSCQFERVERDFPRSEILEEIPNTLSSVEDDNVLPLVKWWVEKLEGTFEKDMFRFIKGTIPFWEYMVSIGHAPGESDISNALYLDDKDLVNWLQSRVQVEEKNVFQLACETSDTTLFEWFMKKYDNPVLEWQKDSLEKCCSLYLVKWALAHGCPEPEDKLAFCIKIASYKYKNDILRWAVNIKGWPIDTQVASEVASTGNLPNLKWVLANISPPFSEIPREILIAGVESGNYNMLRWAFDNKGLNVNDFVRKLTTKFLWNQSFLMFAWFDEMGILKDGVRSDWTTPDPRIRKIMKKYIKREY